MKVRATFKRCIIIQKLNTIMKNRLLALRKHRETLKQHWNIERKFIKFLKGRVAPGQWKLVQNLIFWPLANVL